jgi:exonuclease SbcC
MIDVALKNLTVRDFRSIRGSINVPLDSPIVLIHGTNGAGKTSVLSALAIALGGAPVAGSDFDGINAIHYGAESAEISLGASSGVHTIPVASSGTDFSLSVLNKADADFFADRCYLAQASLGRLLDLYQDETDGSESPLTRFVKELLNLDALDALIDGLYPSGHVARVRRLVEPYRTFEGRQEALVQEREKALTQKASALGEVSAIEESVAGRLDDGSAELVPERISDLIEHLKAVRDDPDPGALVAARQELSGIMSRWDSVASQASTLASEGALADEGEARSRYEQWLAGPGAVLDAAIGGLREYFPELSTSRSLDPGAALQDAISRSTSEIDRCRSLLEADGNARSAAVELAAEVAELQQTLGELETALSSDRAATEIDALAKAIAALAPHIGGNTCPVCGRDYSEVSKTSLAEHVSQEIASLTSHANRLQSLARGRLQTGGDLRRAEANLADKQGARLPDETRADLERRMALLQPLHARLIETQPSVKSGGDLARALATARDRLADARTRDTTTSEVRSGANRVAQALGRQLRGDEPLVQALEALRVGLDEKLSEIEERRRRREQLLTGMKALIAARTQSQEAELRLAKIEGELATVRRALRTSTRRMEAARRLLHAAEEERAAIIAAVFNDSLNSIWRELFIRLSPDEPFVPCFRLPETPGKIDAELETKHRDGTAFGSPGAMLSAGNLNTAALTLFLALHLSAPPRLPWLLLDDPVQSMDEVHVSQFAALLRTITRQHKRRLVLACHERALFEYLSLELSPTSAEERLVAVELTRSLDGDTIATPRIVEYEADVAIAA